jgi:hypothetical protein
MQRPDCFRRHPFLLFHGLSTSVCVDRNQSRHGCSQRGHCAAVCDFATQGLPNHPAADRFPVEDGALTTTTGLHAPAPPRRPSRPSSAVSSSKRDLLILLTPAQPRPQFFEPSHGLSSTPRLLTASSSIGSMGPTANSPAHAPPRSRLPRSRPPALPTPAGYAPHPAAHERPRACLPKLAFRPPYGPRPP